MKYTDAYKPKNIIRNKADGIIGNSPKIIEFLQDFEEYKKYALSNNPLCTYYLDKIKSSLELYETQIKRVDEFYKKFRAFLSSEIDLEKSLHRKNFGTEAGLVQARNILDTFYVENKYQQELNLKERSRIYSLQTIRENLELLDTEDENIKARVEVILELINEISGAQEQNDENVYDYNDDNTDSSLKDAYFDELGLGKDADTHGDEETVQPKIKIMSSIRAGDLDFIDAMLTDVLYLKTDSGDNLYSKIVVTQELPKDFRETDLYHDTLFILVEENINEEVQEVFIGKPTEDSESGFYMELEEPETEEVVNG